jgi:hypothetical protein
MVGPPAAVYRVGFSLRRLASATLRDSSSRSAAVTT